MVLLGGALAAVVVLGRRAGPSTPGSSRPAAVSTPAGSAATATAAPTELEGFVATADLTPEEQVILVRLNEVRANPPSFLPHWKDYLGKDTGKSCVEEASMLDPIAGYQPRQPLAPNQALTNAARKHAQDMIDRNYFEHVNPGGVGPNMRVTAAGYPLPVGRGLTPNGGAYGADETSANIESIHFRGSSDPNAKWTGDAWRDAIDSLVVDACVPSRGHRLHLLGVHEIGAYELEVGVGGVAGKGAGQWASKMTIAIEIAMRGDDTRFVTGVVYKDANGNKQYDYGEGLADVEVVLGKVSTKTNRGGGYALPVRPGTKGEVVAGGAKVPVDVGDQNVHVDFTGR